MTWTIFESQTGQILKVVSCPEDHLSVQYDPATQSALPGAFDDSAFYIKDLSPVRIPERPSDRHVFDFILKQWVAVGGDVEDAWLAVRIQRDKFIASTDWTQLPDVPLATKEAWAAYRQALRDVTLQPDPFNIAWPAVPG